MRVAIRRKNLVNVALTGADELQNRDIECAAAEIVDGDVSALLFVEAIGQRRGSRLIDETQNFKAGEAAGVFGSLALRVIKIGRNCNDRAIDCVAEIFLGPRFELAKNAGGNFRWRENLLAEPNADHVAACLVDPKRKAR